LIIGIGTDLVEIKRVERIIQRYGERFLERIFTERERAECGRRPQQQAEAFAARFAAKEAAMKALGTGYRQGVVFRDIEVRHQPSGKPELLFSGLARERAVALGTSSAHVSLTHDGGNALAVVILEG
jgi:holo-[acyl-carrier protein] synthase